MPPHGLHGSHPAGLLRAYYYQFSETSETGCLAQHLRLCWCCPGKDKHKHHSFRECFDCKREHTRYVLASEGQKTPTEGSYIKQQTGTSLILVG